MRSDHALLAQRVEVGLAESEESAVHLVVVGTENRRRLVESRLMSRELDRHASASGGRYRAVHRMLEGNHHVPRVQVLVLERIPQIADGPRSEVMLLENLRGLGRRALADPFLQEGVDVVAVGPSVARARLESRIRDQLRAT